MLAIMNASQSTYMERDQYLSHNIQCGIKLQICRILINSYQRLELPLMQIKMSYHIPFKESFTSLENTYPYSLTALHA